jgi:hypothetical protein
MAHRWCAMMEWRPKEMTKPLQTRRPEDFLELEERAA